MAISVNIQRIKSARARRITEGFSTVDLFCDEHDHIEGWRGEISIYVEGPGHEDAAARIAALINEQVVRCDAPPAAEPEAKLKFVPCEGVGDNNGFYEIGGDDGPAYDEADDEQQRQEAEQRGVSLGEAREYAEERAAYNREAAAEEAAYNEEDRLGEEAHLRSARRDDKPWTPYEDEIERDVAEGRRDADGEPI